MRQNNEQQQQNYLVLNERATASYLQGEKVFSILLLLIVV